MNQNKKLFIKEPKQQNKNKREGKFQIKRQKRMTSSYSRLIKQYKGQSIANQTVNLPRFNREFIGIGHQLQQKKRQRRKIQEQQRTMANRVIYLQKQELRAQQSLKRKKVQLAKTLQTIQQASQKKSQIQDIRRTRQLELDALRQENRKRRLSRKEAQQSARYSIEAEKHSNYSRIKSFIKEKQREKQDLLFQDLKQKKNKWLSLNIDKQRGRQKIDLFYKKKNAEHTLAYIQRIEKEQATKMQKINTIKHLELFDTALRKKLQQSTSRISHLNDRIMRSSRTLDGRGQESKQRTSIKFLLPKKQQRRLKHQNLASYTVEPYNPQQQMQLDICFQRDKAESERAGSLSERVKGSRQHHQSLINEGIEQLEYPEIEQIQLPAFKIIRTVRKRKKSAKNQENQHQLL